MGNESGTGVSGALGSDEELQSRLVFTRPDDVVRGIFFNSVLELLRQEGNDALVCQCTELSGESRFLEFFNYPMSKFLRMVYPTAWSLAPRHGGFERALWYTGYLGSKAFYASSAGKVLLLLARNDPLRLLNNMPSTTHAVLGDHTGITQMKRTGQTHAVLTYLRDLTPRPYNEGALCGSLEAVGGRDVKVRAHPQADFDTDYEISWS